MCQPAKEGFQVLVVWLEKKDGSDPGSVEGKLFDASKGVPVKAEDGSQTDSFSAGLTNGKLFVAFTPPVSARNFTLPWPDNSPIELGKQHIHWQMKTNLTHEKALKRAAAQQRVVADRAARVQDRGFILICRL